MDSTQSADLTVLQTLLGWRRRSCRALLATVVRTWGSSPRPVGSVMALCEDGSVAGSVSGGCIEDDLVHRFTRAYAGIGVSGTPAPAMPQGSPKFLKYGLSADEAHRAAARWSCCLNSTRNPARWRR